MVYIYIRRSAFEEEYYWYALGSHPRFKLFHFVRNWWGLVHALVPLIYCIHTFADFYIILYICMYYFFSVSWSMVQDRPVHNCRTFFFLFFHDKCIYNQFLSQLKRLSINLILLPYNRACPSGYLCFILGRYSWKKKHRTLSSKDPRTIDSSFRNAKCEINSDISLWVFAYHSFCLYVSFFCHWFSIHFSFSYLDVLCSVEYYYSGVRFFSVFLSRFNSYGRYSYHIP